MLIIYPCIPADCVIYCTSEALGQASYRRSKSHKLIAKKCQTNILHAEGICMENQDMRPKIEGKFRIALNNTHDEICLSSIKKKTSHLLVPLLRCTLGW